MIHTFIRVWLYDILMYVSNFIIIEKQTQNKTKTKKKKTDKKINKQLSQTQISSALNVWKHKE